MDSSDAMRQPALDLAILIVNGKFNYRDHLWLDLSVGNLIRHTSPRTNYRIFVFNHDRDNPRVASCLESVGEHVEVVSEDSFDVGRWPGERVSDPAVPADYFAGGCHVHRGALQMLFEHATARFDVETVFTFDTDSWPLRDNWELPLLDRLDRDVRLVGVWRDELQAVIPPFVHASCLGVKAETVRELGLRFDREPLPPREDTLSHFTVAVTNRFGTGSVLRLTRSNRFQHHAVFNGVYGGLVYHHHLGTRYRDGRSPEPRTYGWAERGESLATNKLVLDATTQMVFSNAEDFCCDLQYGADALRLKPFVHYLRNVGLERGRARLLEEARSHAELDPVGSDFILGLVGRHYAEDHDFLALQAETCRATPRAWEEASWRRLGGLGDRDRPAGQNAPTVLVPTTRGPAESLGLEHKPGEPHYRAFVGPPQEYDLIAAMVFNLLTTLGLRQHHQLLDVGCGSLRNGRLLIPYLNAGCYTGVEPNEWLVQEGIAREVGHDLVAAKMPRFLFTAEPRDLPAGESFAFSVAQSVLSHCTLELIEHWLAELHSRLRPDGVLVATFRAADEDFSHPEGLGPKDFQGAGWVYPKCPGYRMDTIRDLGVSCGFEVELLDWKHPRQRWVLFARERFDTTWFAGRPLTWNTMLEHLASGRG